MEKLEHLQKNYLFLIFNVICGWFNNIMCYINFLLRGMHHVNAHLNFIANIIVNIYVNDTK